MNANAPFITSVTSSGSRRSAMAVEPTTSANSTVTSLRSPAAVGAGAGVWATLDSSACPQLEQNLACSLLGVWQRGQIMANIPKGSNLDPPLCNPILKPIGYGSLSQTRRLA